MYMYIHAISLYFSLSLYIYIDVTIQTYGYVCMSYIYIYIYIYDIHNIPSTNRTARFLPRRPSGALRGRRLEGRGGRRPLR